jgi:methionyl-tRNA synthetase
MPWVLAKDEDKQDRLRTVLYNLLESIRSGAILLSAFLPDTANSIFEQLNVENAGIDSVGFDFIPDGTVLNDPTPLFARIDKNKKLEELLNK